MTKSLLDHAYDFVSQNKGPVAFKDIWAYVCEQAQLDEATADKRISSFYTNLMLDGRLVTLGDNKWDLRTRQPFEKTHIDMNDVYKEIDDDNDDQEELEEIEYEESFKERKNDFEDETDEESEEESEEEDEEN